MIKPRKKLRPGRLKGQDLANLRADCLLRDGCRCVECHEPVTDAGLEWHPRKYHMAHIQAKRRGGDSLDNVRTLCAECHRKEHNYGPSLTKPCPKKMPPSVPTPEMTDQQFEELPY